MINETSYKVISDEAKKIPFVSQGQVSLDCNTLCKMSRKVFSVVTFVSAQTINIDPFSAHSSALTPRKLSLSKSVKSLL